MIIPNNAIKFILFQRTAYLKFPRVYFYQILNKILPFSLYNLLVVIEAIVRVSSVKALYEADMKREYLLIKDYLPQTCSSVLDIGCGCAGIDVFINLHYSHNKTNFYLLDKTHIEKNVYYFFNPKGAFYNSLCVTKTMLTENGVPSDCVHLIEATDTNDIEIDNKVDFIISLLSWGHHYPVTTYLDKAYNILNEGGSMLLDIRKGSDGLDVLRNKLSKVDIISEEDRNYRVIAIK